jgi:hypothetical protein
MKSRVAALILASLVSSLSCGRSERIGWGDREKPDSVTPPQETSAMAQPAAAPSSAEPVMEEYGRLVNALAEVQFAAMGDEAVAAQWNDLNNEVEALILARSEFHRGLVERRDEIERLIAEDERSSVTMSPQRRAELARHYRNIQVEMARVRNEEFRKPEYAPRLRAFQTTLFDRMRELAPDRVAEIDRMEYLETTTILQPEPALEGAGPEAPSTGPLLPPEALERIRQQQAGQPGDTARR